MGLPWLMLAGRVGRERARMLQKSFLIFILKLCITVEETRVQRAE